MGRIQGIKKSEIRLSQNYIFKEPEPIQVDPRRNKDNH
jgi:hypothetical protein